MKRDANPQVVLNNLYKHTNFQVNYGISLLMLDNGVPKTLGLKSNHISEVLEKKRKTQEGYTFVYCKGEE